MSTKGKQIFTTLEADGKLTVDLAESTFPDPKGDEVLVKIEAAPINPSDLILLFDQAKLEDAEYSTNKVVCKLSKEAVERAKGRFGQRLPVGNEGAGTVIATGDSPAAKALLNRRVACVSGSTYATHAVVDAKFCHVLPDDIPTDIAASSYVNPMTVLSFVETMKRDGYNGIVHLAAASNLGRMLNRVCLEDGIPLVNVVRKDAQVDTLRSDGAKIVLNSTDADFGDKLQAAIAETGAYVGFNPIGGGDMTDQCLKAMEGAAATQMKEYSRYGSTQHKTMYIYGNLDMSATTISRSYGFAWNVSGWLLTGLLAKLSPEKMRSMWDRSIENLRTTFKSDYKGRVTLEEMMKKDAAVVYSAMRSGEKFLVTP